MVACGCAWLYMAGHMAVRLYVVVPGCIWLYMVVYSCMWLYMAVYGCMWLNIATYCCIWLYMSLYCYLCLYCGCCAARLHAQLSQNVHFPSPASVRSNTPLGRRPGVFLVSIICWQGETEKHTKVFYLCVWGQRVRLHESLTISNKISKTVCFSSASLRNTNVLLFLMREHGRFRSYKCLLVNTCWLQS